MKKILLLAAAALMLSGCILDDDFWDDGYDSGYDYPSGDDCDCDDGYFTSSFAAPPHAMPNLAPSEMTR